jgi:hypothetical protein
MAAKLARFVYRMLRYGMKYVDRGAEFYEAQYRKQQVSYLKRRAAQLGSQIIEAAALTSFAVMRRRLPDLRTLPSRMVSHIELLADRTWVNVFFFKGECGTACHDMELLDLRQCIDDLFGDAIGKEIHFPDQRSCW